MASSTEHQNQREDEGGRTGGSWAYLLPQTHQGFNYMYNFPENALKTSRTALPQRYKGKARSRWVGEAERQFVWDPGTKKWVPHWKSMRLNSERAGGLQKTKTPFLKGLHTNLLDLRHIKAAVWETPGLYMKEMCWLILGHVPKVQGSAGTFSGAEMLAGTIFLPS